MFKPASMSTVIPSGSCGTAKIVHDIPDDFTMLRASLHGQPLDKVPYTRLLVGNTLWMTDAEYEWRTNIRPVMDMDGDVLIAGLGIGFIICPLLKKDKVKSITVLEKNRDVISLVGSHLANEKLKIIEADVYNWTAPRLSYDCIYFDIWPNVLNADDWPDIKLLKKKYRPSLRTGGWIAAWCEDQAKEDAYRETRESKLRY